MCDHLEHLDPSWRLCIKEPVSVWPSLPNPSESIDFWVSIWHVGYTSESCIKGKSKAFRILECVEDLLSVPYSSLRSTLFLRVLGPRGGPTSTHGPLQCQVVLWPSKCLSCQLILLAVSDLKLSDKDMSSVQCLLEPLLVVSAVWASTTTY